MSVSIIIDGPLGPRVVNLADGARPVQIFEFGHPAARTLFQRGHDGRWWAVDVYCGPAAPYPGATRPISPPCPDCPDFRPDSVAHLRDHILVNHPEHCFDHLEGM